MGFLCKTIENKYLDDPLNRDLALSNIYNVNSDTNFCFESFSGPSYYLSGATKATTGSTGNICVYSNWEITLSNPCTFDLYDCNGDVYDTVSYTGAGVYNVCSVDEPNSTIPCLGVLITNVGICSTEFTVCSGTPTNCYAVYNLSEVDDFQLDFNFTGSTDYTGYTGQFCYRLYNRLNFKLGEATKTINKEVPNYINCVDFSAITSSTLTQILGVSDIPKIDTDYMLRSYYNFTPKECGTSNINTWETSTQLNNFDIESNTDWYFITVTNPPIPNLTIVDEPFSDEISLKQETIMGQDYKNFFNLADYPINNEINLYVNGIKLTELLDYTIDSSNFPTTTPVIEILDANIEKDDIITIVYLVGGQSFLTNEGVSRNDFFEIESFFVTGFTTNVTASTINIVNNNTIKNTQEVFLTNDFSDSSDIVVVLNGVKLIQDIEYYKSSTTKNKIIFNPNFTTINVGDILSFWYFKTTLGDNTNLGTLRTNSVDIPWTISEEDRLNVTNGYFIVEATETSDVTWSSLFYSEKVLYTPDIDGYLVKVDNLTPNTDYKFRIIFSKVYFNILNEEIITSSQIEGLFNTKNDEINYKY